MILFFLLKCAISFFPYREVDLLLQEGVTYHIFSRILTKGRRNWANIASQHLLPKILARFAVATNMLAKRKIPQNVAPTFINMLINVGQLWATLLASFASCFDLLYLPTFWTTFSSLESFLYVIRIFISFLNVVPPFLIKQQQSPLLNLFYIFKCWLKCWPKCLLDLHRP